MKKKSSAPSISLIVTTYNSPEFLEIVLKSILRQTECPLEVIVADDGSGEKTFRVIEKYQRLFSIPLVHSWIEDKGFRVAKSRNEAVAKAQGEYIILIDGDMVVNSHFIADHRLLMKKGRFVTGSRARLSEKATLQRKESLDPAISFFSCGLHRRLVLLRLKWGHLFLKGHTGLSHARSCHMAFWKEDFIKVNGFEESFEGWGYEDSEFIQRLYNAGLTRKNAKLLAPAIHLFHHEREDEKAMANWERLQETIRNRRIYAQQGIDQYL